MHGEVMLKTARLLLRQWTEAAKEALKFGATELKASQQKPWGQMVSYLRSPSGILLELCTPIGN